MNDSNRINRFFSGVVLVAFFATNTLVPAPLSYAQGIETPSFVSSFKIPEMFGKVNEIVPAAPNAPILIHIQEAHANFDAQKNIRNILQYLMQDYGVTLILMEGAGNKLTPEIFNFFPEDASLQQTTNDKLMQAGKLTGAEVFLLDQITSAAERKKESNGKAATSFGREGQAEAYGVENAKAYAEGREAYRKVYEGRRISGSFLEAFYRQWQKAADHSLGKSFREFLRHELDFEEGRFPLQDWMSLLKIAAARELQLDIDDISEQKTWPVLVRYFRLKEVSSRTDLAKVDVEKEKFFNELNALDKAGSLKEGDKTKTVASRHFSSMIQEITDVFGSAKKGELPIYKTRFVFERLMDALPEDFSFEAYPALRLYIQQMVLLSEIQSESLHAEMNALTQKISVALAKTEQEKKMFEALQAYHLLSKLFALELNREEFQRLQAQAVTPEKVATSLKLRSSKLAPVTSLFETAVRFYETAITREDFMMRRVREVMAENKQTKAVLITGGFHEEGFKEKVMDSGSSYISITPAIGEVTADSQKNYLKAFLGDEAVAISHQAPLVRSELRFLEEVSPKNWRREWAREGAGVAEIVRQVNPAGVQAVRHNFVAATTGFGMNAVSLRSEVRKAEDEKTTLEEVIGKTKFRSEIESEAFTTEAVGLGANSIQEILRRSEMREGVSENRSLFIGMGPNGWKDQQWARTPDWQRLNTVMGVLLELSWRGEKIPLHDILSLSFKKLNDMGLGVDDTALMGLLEMLRVAGLIIRDDGSFRLAKSSRNIAAQTDNAFYIKQDIEMALQASEEAVEKVVLEYAVIVKEWPLYPVEIQWPVLRAVALLDKERRTKLVDILEKKEELMGYPVLVDSILLMLFAKSVEGWLQRYAPHLVGRDIYYVSPETILLAGGLGRVGQFHTMAGRRLAGKDAKIILVEPRYQSQWVPVVQRIREKYGLNYKAQTAVRTFLKEDGQNIAVKGEELVRAMPLLSVEKASEILSEAWALYEKGEKKGYFEEKIDYQTLPTPVLDIRSRFDFNVAVRGNPVEAKTFSGRTPDGTEVELIDGGNYYTRLLYRYGSLYRSATFGEFTEFFSRAVLELGSRLQSEKQRQVKTKNYKAPIFWVNDGQLGPFPVFKRMLDNASDILVKAFVWMVTHTYRNRGNFDAIAAGLNEYWRRFFDRLGFFDSTSGGVRTADGASAVSAIHRDESAGIDSGVKLDAITNGDDLEASASISNGIFKEFFPQDDPWDPTPEQMIRVKEEAKIRLGLKWGWDLDPHKILIAYSGRLVPEKAGRQRAFNNDNLRKLVAAGAQVVIFGNVQDGTQGMFDQLQELADEINETGPGKLYVVTGWGPIDQRELLAAEDLQVNDSDRDPDRGTGAAEITETNGAANGSLQMGPPWIEGIIQRQGIILDWAVSGSGNTLVPANESPKAYMDVFEEVIKQFEGNRQYFSTYQVVAKRLSLVLNATLTAAAYFRKFDEGIRRKENLQNLTEKVKKAFAKDFRHTPKELRILLEDLAEKDVLWIGREYGEAKIPALMALIAVLTPEIIGKTKDWDPENFEILDAVLKDSQHTDLFKLGSILLLSNENKDVLHISRVLDDKNLVFPIHLGSSVFDQYYSEGKIWDTVFDLGRVIGGPDALLCQTWDLSLEKGKGIPYEAKRKREDMGKRWRVGIPVHSWEQGQSRDGRHYQILKIKQVDAPRPTLVRSEARDMSGLLRVAVCPTKKLVKLEDNEDQILLQEMLSKLPGQAAKIQVMDFETLIKDPRGDWAVEIKQEKGRIFLDGGKDLLGMMDALVLVNSDGEVIVVTDAKKTVSGRNYFSKLSATTADSLLGLPSEGEINGKQTPRSETRQSIPRVVGLPSPAAISERADTFTRVEQFIAENVRLGGGTEQGFHGVTEKLTDGIVSLLANALDVAQEIIAFLPSSLAQKTREALMQTRFAAARGALGIKTIRAGDAFILGREFALGQGFLAATRAILGDVPVAVIVRSAKDRAFVEKFNEGLVPGKRVLIISETDIVGVRAALGKQVKTERMDLKALLYAGETLKNQLSDITVQRITPRMFQNFLRLAGDQISAIVQEVQAQFSLSRSA